ncbi:MAG: cytochrome c oxidase subunit II [Chloroflexi bacterium]|nr:cytochrome c oxidase subunit II [Chloroflexota bacterium]
MKKHIIIVACLAAALSAGLVAFLLRVNFMPPEAAAQAGPVDRLFDLLLVVAAVVFALCLVGLVYSAVVFRRRRGDAADGPPWHGHVPIEVAWTIVPLVIVLFFSVYGAVVLKDITRPSGPIPELEVRVTASQWSWRFEYPEYQVASSELRLPVNRPVLLRLHATDVIHSFWVPEFRSKQDAVPGMDTILRITPNRTGEYKVECAEMCGIAHAYMLAPVRVVEPSAFEQWAREQKR